MSPNRRRSVITNTVKNSTRNSAPGGSVLVFSAPPAASGNWTLTVGNKPRPDGTFDSYTPHWTFAFPAP